MNRRPILLLILGGNLALLSLATAWVFRSHPAVFGSGSDSARIDATVINPARIEPIGIDPAGIDPAVQDSVSPGGQAPPIQTSAVASPVRAGFGADAQLKAGPKFIISGVADREQNAWFGTEEQGVFEYAAGQWKQFTSADGLGDDQVGALACDALGRVWAGHLSHGVSVFNGTAWKNFDCLLGCGGSHVFCIATCPTDGDVWIGTEAGLTRYSLKDDSWRYYDRSTGMPADLTSSLAFDSRGNLFAGLQADGIAVAHPEDGYSHWTSIKGPDQTPIGASGSGLASSLINAMLVTRDDSVYAGTCRGLACSKDHGNTWAYIRGKNWPALARGRYEGVPDHVDLTPRTPLAEDWITTLAEDPAGMIWIGYQNAGYQAFMPDAATADSEVKRGYITAIVPYADGHCINGTYGVGAWERGVRYTGPAAVRHPAPVSAKPPDAFPTPGAAPDTAALDAMRRRVESLPPPADGVEFLPDDWETRGDWISRYGNQFADMLGHRQFWQAPGYQLGITSGPWQNAIWRYYWEGFNVPIDHIAYLLDPAQKKRLFGEYNDESYDIKAHPRVQEGPDLFLRVTVPAGVHVVSLYFHCHDAHGTGYGKIGVSGQRDFVLQVKNPSPGGGDEIGDGDGAEAPERNIRLFPADAIDAELAPTLARSRVSSFYPGVYKRLLIRGAGSYWIKINRNHSPGAKVSGMFIDRQDLPPSSGHAWFGRAYEMPASTDYTADPGAKGAAARLFAAVDASMDRPGAAELAARARQMAYIAGSAAGIDEQTLANWRRKMLLWTEPDREQFDDAAGIAPAMGL